jgi:hypothetical protein
MRERCFRELMGNQTQRRTIMANYVLVYKGGSGMAPSEAEREAIMAAWTKWFGGLGAALVDAGNPFGPSSVVASDGTVQAGAPSALTGYSILSADDLHAATVMAKGCPALADGGSVEVYETFQVM